MNEFVELKNDDLFQTEGGIPVIPIISGVLTAIRWGVCLYEYAKDEAAKAGVNDAYRDMGMTNQ